MICHNCRQRAICKIYNILENNAAMIQYDISECKYSVVGSHIIEVPDNTASAASNLAAVLAEDKPDNAHIALYESSESEVGEAFEQLVAPSDPPIVPDENCPKKKCSSCGKMVPEILMTETLDGREICEECFDKEDDRELLARQEMKNARRSRGEWTC